MLGLSKREYHKLWREKNWEHVREYAKQQAKKRRSQLSAEERHAIYEKRKKYQAEYKQQHEVESKQYQREYYLSHYQQRLQQSYEARDRRRAARNGVDWERISRAALWERDKGICGICREKIESLKEGSIDHIIPISLGGKHTWNNIQLAHLDCNRRKNNRGPIQMSLGQDISVYRKRPKHAKLTEEQVRYIRSSDLSYRKLEQVIGIHWRTIADVRQGKTWKHVQ